MKMNKAIALELLRSAVEDKDCALENPESFYRHIFGVQLYSKELAKQLFSKGYDINPDEEEIAGITHDIGRTKQKSYEGGTDVHEYVTGNVLREEGYPEVADLEQRHFIAYQKAEQILVPRGVLGTDGKPVKPEDYRQIKLPEKVLTFADYSVGSDGKICNWRVKLRDTLKKYSEGERANPVILRLLKEGGYDWVKGICEEVESLLKK